MNLLGLLGLLLRNLRLCLEILSDGRLLRMCWCCGNLGLLWQEWLLRRWSLRLCGQCAYRARHATGSQLLFFGRLKSRIHGSSGALH